MQSRGVLFWMGLTSSTLLAGCNVTPFTTSAPESTQATQSQQPEPTATELEQGVRDIVHPEPTIVEVVPEPVVIPETDVWARVASQLQFDIPEQKRIANQRNWYLKHPEYMQRVMKRARPFVYFIVEQIEAREMPLELVLLPIVESAFDPFAYSHGRAAGMWQFIPDTAKRFGMSQTWWYDGRRDVIASTQGALDYLTYLHKYFDGNWLHALAAYNSGEGRVRRAIRKNKKEGKSTDFWALSLPRETRAYVPKLLALADILANKEQYAFTWPEVDNQPVIEVVDIESQIDLALAADMAGMELDALHALNAGFNRWATDPDGPHRLVLPLANVEQFSNTLASTDRKERLNWVRYQVKRGDSLLKLANKFHTTSDIIKQVNELKSHVIIAGDHLMIPVALKSLSTYSLSNDERLAATQNRKRAAHKLVHTVRAGDTLWDLSREHKVRLSSLAKWNGMAPKDPLMPGKELVIWVNKVSDSQRDDAIMRKVSYKVRRGDSIARIASKFHVKSKDIIRWNNLNPKRYLQPGQTLVLHVDVTQSTG